MSTTITLEDIQRAWSSQDPELPRLLVALTRAPDARSSKPQKQGALTFQKYYQEIRGWAFPRKSKEEQAHYRIERMKELEEQDPNPPLPDRLKLWKVLLDLWQENGPYERSCLIEIIGSVPLKWGPWRALKKIFKEAEERGDTEIYGALAARVDESYQSHVDHEVTRRTLAYMRRRAWRYLRRQAETLPACYVDAAVDVLRFYTLDSNYNWRSTWVANHIWYHERGGYGRGGFSLPWNPPSPLKHRAYPELWRRTPRPLFNLLERARSERVRAFAVEALKTDFRASLREVEPAWVGRLINVRSESIDDFAVWLLKNVPRFEQGSFRELGLHEPVLSLLSSPSTEARGYAASYARTHARDLPLDQLIRLIDNDHEGVQKLAIDLIQDRDPRKEVGLEAWGRLLETHNGHELAAQVLRKHFGTSELTPEWFRERLLSENDRVFEFASAQLPKVHTYKSLGPAFFQDFIEDARIHEQSMYQALAYGFENLERYDIGSVDGDVLKRALICEMSSEYIRGWIDNGRLAPSGLGLDFLRSLAYHPSWEKNAWVAELKDSGRPWVEDLEFNEELSSYVLNLLADVRSFSPQELGFDWFMELVQCSEPRYHDFAVEYMTKAFKPADFAEGEEQEEEQPASAEDADLGGESYLFTGKLATMTRKEAKKKVTDAKGKNASSVTAKLDYLVIGDEGSPLYDQGRKGSKQVKAESLNDKGAGIKIISETAFLQMLSGQVQSFSEDAVEDGCERLWSMATEPEEETPLSRFALGYIRHHHVDIAPQLTDRHVDPGAEIPASFLSFERVRPLLTEARTALRKLALELARWELRRWDPSMEDLVELCESPHSDVFDFLSRALLADDREEHKRYRIDPEKLKGDAVYRFCESLDKPTRALGMKLIARDASLADPTEFFRLSESPDRQVQAFVIRTLWALYRDRGITMHWRPPEKPVKEGEAAAPPSVLGRPEVYPATPMVLRDFLRHVLFTVAPARLPKAARATSEKVRLKPLPARKAKLSLIEVMRDLAIEDADFAALMTPLFEEFMDSRGKSEQAACLVAMTRIRKAHPSGAGEEGVS